MTRYIFIIGGVISGVGKGVAAASLGRILKSKGFRVSALKIDPYINVDAGTMNPIEHGEVFVTEDGDETDQDIGHYERFIGHNILSDNYMTSGRVYRSVIEAERGLEYGGKCVETIPHIPEEIIRRIRLAAKKSRADFLLVEVGGTIGEYQNVIYFEAARMMKLKNPAGVITILVSYLPIPAKLGEMKTKPTQMAIRSLNSVGIQPNFVVGRSQKPLDSIRKEKIAVVGNIAKDNVISDPDSDSIYQVPLIFEKENLGNKVLAEFNLKKKRSRLSNWRKFVRTAEEDRKVLRIGIVGKYFKSGSFVLADSYISVIEAVKHAAWSLKRKPKIEWLNSESYQQDKTSLQELSKFDAVIVPGGFGSRGVEGKISAINYLRENKIPFLGLCYGLQLAIIEIARNLAGLNKANTTEIDPETPYPVVDILPDQKKKVKEEAYGGTMRLGGYRCRLEKGTVAYRAYRKKSVQERHRHRYEVNNRYLSRLKKKGLIVSGRNIERNLVEIIEFKGHPFFVGTQFHPEFKSRPLRPHPLFKELLRTAIRLENTLD